MESAITSKGQATIPKAVRDHLGLKPGDRVKFFVHPAAILNATDLHPVAPRHSEPRLTESDWQQVAELVISSHRE